MSLFNSVNLVSLTEDQDCFFFSPSTYFMGERCQFGNWKYIGYVYIYAQLHAFFFFLVYAVLYNVKRMTEEVFLCVFVVVLIFNK